MAPSLIPDDTAGIYQLRIWLKGISPMIWRRLLVESNSTIADLHHTIQIAMGWDDDHLNQFFIRGKSYGVPHIGGIGFSDNAKQVYLSDFQFRLKEKFIYEYNFFDHWEHEIRFEKQLPVDRKKTYPLCIGGKRCVPPEDCGGAWSFMELQDHYSLWSIEDQLIELFEGDEDDDQDEDFINDTLQTLADWLRKYHLFKLNCPEINNELRQYFKEKQEENAIIRGG
ncbi:MAG: hypothetical protein BGO77_02795 [Caedibacter sp. 37-49]|nr:MAG: hypothetical protein BGO77_02795 [Caedibacter sp. 37-49]